MGLDQYAILKDADGNEVQSEFFYWRKHPDLNRWIEKLWRKRENNTEDTFNCVEVELFAEDIEALEKDVIERNLETTTGFFFGVSSEEDRNYDLEFIKAAKQALSEGYRVFYDSWW